MNNFPKTKGAIGSEFNLKVMPMFLDSHGKKGKKLNQDYLE